MKRVRTFFLHFRNLFHKEQLDRELRDELASHLELHIADNIRSGMSPEEARRDATRPLHAVWHQPARPSCVRIRHCNSAFRRCCGLSQSSMACFAR